MFGRDRKTLFCWVVFLAVFQTSKERKDRVDNRGPARWKRMEEVPCRTSLLPPRVPFFVLIVIGLEAKGLLAFQGRRGIASAVRWNLRPVMFDAEEGTRLRPSDRHEANRARKFTRRFGKIFVAQVLEGA